jgi:hypothetical protein
MMQGVVKPAPGLDFASKPDVRLGVKLGHEAMSADFMSTRPSLPPLADLGRLAGQFFPL